MKRFLSRPLQQTLQPKTWLWAGSHICVRMLFGEDMTSDIAAEWLSPVAAGGGGHQPQAGQGPAPTQPRNTQGGAAGGGMDLGEEDRGGTKAAGRGASLINPAEEGGLGVPWSWSARGSVPAWQRPKHFKMDFSGRIQTGAARPNPRSLAG